MQSLPKLPTSRPVDKPACFLFLLDWRPVFWSTREEFIRQIARRISACGITPVITTSEEVTEPVLRLFEEAGARVIACSYPADPLSYWRHIRRMSREYTVLLAHLRFFDYFSFVFWLCRLSGIRNVLFTEANSGERKRSRWKLASLRLRTKIMCYPILRVIAISEFVRARLVDVGIPSDRVQVIYNGIDTLKFLPDETRRLEVRAAQNVQPGTTVISYASALLAWKRPEVAIHVCAELIRRGEDVQLWVAGNGPLRDSLEKLVERLGVTAQVRWLGYQPDLQRWLAASDLFLHTALGEAFGNVLMEAMACGLPVVASKSGATPELVREGETGFLVSNGATEVEEFTRAVQQLIKNGERRTAMGVAARTEAQQFNVQGCVDQTLAEYERVLGRVLKC